MYDNNPYNQIALPFSRTRRKVWPKVVAFLDSLQPATPLLEIGCGNGKNLLYRNDLVAKGVDTAEELLAICRERGLSTAYGDARALPIATAAYPAVLCIAVLHHLPTREERRQALQELWRVLAFGGQALLSVWAFQQDPTERRQFATQDELVPFHTPTGVVYRPYHLYTAEELKEDLDSLETFKTGEERCTWSISQERGNWYCILSKERDLHGVPA